MQRVKYHITARVDYMGELVLTDDDYNKINGLKEIESCNTLGNHIDITKPTQIVFENLIRFKKVEGKNE